MRLNGTVNIERDDNANYVVTYAPIGVDHVGRPQRRFKGWQHLVAFLQGPLHVGAPEVRSALNALFRNGAFAWTGSGSARRRSRSRAWGRSSVSRLPGASPTLTPDRDQLLIWNRNRAWARRSEASASWGAAPREKMKPRYSEPSGSGTIRWPVCIEMVMSSMPGTARA